MWNCLSNRAVRGGVSAVVFAAALGHVAWAQAPNATSEHMRSYQLKHATAAEIVAVLQKAHGEQKPSSAQANAAQPGQAAQPAQPNATAGQQPPNAQAPKAGQGKERLHLAPDGQVLYARGPAEELRRLDEVVKALDKARGEAGGLYFAAIEGTDAKALSNLLSQLELKADTITCGNTTLVVALDADSRKDFEAFLAEYQKNKVNSKSQPGQAGQPAQAGQSAQAGQPKAVAQAQ